VPFTRAGCDVGDFSTANMVLENVPVDIPNVFGANSPEAAQLAADTAGAPYWTPKSPTTSGSPCTAPEATQSARTPRR
jgi:hypothetical protein